MSARDVARSRRSDPVHVLIIDDDEAVGTVLGGLLRQAGMKSDYAREGEQGIGRLERQPVDLVITDLRMPGLDGMGVLERITSEWSDIPVIMLTAHGTVPMAVEAMRAGAADFILKPFDRDEILFAIEKALTLNRGTGGSSGPGPRGSGVSSGTSHGAEVDGLVDRAAGTTATVLIRGETGTGKDRVARAIHNASQRASKPFVKVHCAAIPDHLLESELFGYEKGAFTGATFRKPGRLELARGGTVYLDEIGDVSLGVQVKLLRILQDREFEPLGGTKTLKADVRFVSATHRNLETLIEEDAFREDLFYRLNVIPINLAPLRQRKAEVDGLVSVFLNQYGEAHGRRSLTMSADARAKLRQHDWPGNIRELQNFVERLVVLSDTDAIEDRDVERELARVPTRHVDGPASGQTNGVSLKARQASAESAAITEALQRAKGNRSLAARLLGISRRTLYNKLDEYAIN